MKISRILRVVVLSTLLSSLAIPGVFAQGSSAQAQQSGVALQRGYRTGYSDGYMAGYRDTIDSVAKNYTRHNEYAKADRAYSKDYGSIEDYRDGYQQGFESGYETGYERRSFESSLPTGLTKRGAIPVDDRTAEVTTDGNGTNPNSSYSDSSDQVSTNTDQVIATSYQSNSNTNPVIIIPRAKQS